MPPKDERSEAQKKFMYYLDETLVFTIMFLMVLFKETIVHALKNDPLTVMMIHLPKIIASAVIAVYAYGKFHESFKYNEKRKPPFFKRLTLAVGFGWGIQSGGDVVEMLLK